MTTLIVDGDMLLFRSCIAVEREAIFGDTHVLYSKFDDARGVLEFQLSDLMEQANTEDVIFALSDTANWRRNIFKPYKANRKDMRKPLAYKTLENWVKDNYETMLFKGIEADDVMGIYANRPGYVIWTLDKDLKQCPGQHLVDDEIITITKEEGDRFHLFQTLTGDTTDNYGGVPGFGPAKANEFLDAPYVINQVEQNWAKSETGTRMVWKKTSTDNMWDGIVSLFHREGFTAQYALTQARVAHILRDGEYDFKNERVKLWMPASN